MNRRFNNINIMMIGIFILIVFVMIIFNVYGLSILGIHFRSDTFLKEYSDNLNIKTTTIQAIRGKIYDKNGNIIAQDNETYTIYAVLNKDRYDSNNKPAFVSDVEYTATILNEILEISVDELIEMMSKDRYQVEFGIKGRNLSLATKEAIEVYDLPGIEFTKTVSRSYPIGVFASHLIGFAQYDETIKSLVGKMGIESIYDKELTGINGRIRSQYFDIVNDYTLPEGIIEQVDAIDGNDIYLTLDKNVQEQLEMSLAQTMKDQNAEKAFGAVMEVETGKMLAWGNYPTFDPKKLNIEDYMNLGTQFAYEPGSTMKAFTYAAAIDTNMYDGSALFDSSTYYMGIKNGNAIRLSSSKNAIEQISNARNRSWGLIDYDTGFRYSSNVGIASLLTDYLDTSVFSDYLDSFGFFQKVEFDGFSEVNGTKNFNYPIEKLALGYGQGSSITMIQLLQAYSAIFNDGEMVKPYVVQQVKNPQTNEIIYLADKTIVNNPIKATTAKQLQQLMYDVVNEEDGSGRYYQVSEVSVIGKTGTAQMFVNGSYSNTQVLTSVVLSFPADDPKIMIYYAFISDYHENLHVDTKPITDLVKKTALLYDLVDDKEVIVNNDQPDITVETYTMPDLINHSKDYVSDKCQNMDIEIIYLGDGNQVIDQYPQAGFTMITNQRVLLLTNANQVSMPNVIGFSRKEIAAFWQMSKIAVTIDGYGIVVSQDISEGSLLYPNSKLHVVLKTE